MKSIIAALVLLFLLLQYQLWFASGGLISAWKRRHEIEKQKVVNLHDKERNEQMKKDIKALKKDHHALEEHARNDLGMVKKDETFYQVIKHDKNQH